MPDNRIGGGGPGFVVGVSFSLGGGKGSGTGLQLKSLTVGPAVTASTQAGDHMMPRDNTNAFAGMAVSTAGTMLLGMAMRLAKKQDVFKTKDLVLDGLVGVQLGAGLMRGRVARSFYSGGLFSLPLQGVNRAVDPSWDYRVGMLTQGLMNVVREEIGGVPVPFQGFRRDPADGQVSLKTGELIVNGAIDTGVDALYYGLGNSLSALIQGKKKTALKMGEIGAAYGTAAGLLTNIALGAPVRIERETIEAGRQLVLDNGGRDLKGIAEHATWRMGGVAQWVAPSWGITLPGARPNVWMSTQVADGPTTVPHESIHLWHMLDQGTISFYGRYFPDMVKFGGYGRNMPTEMEAYHFTNPLDGDPVYNGDPMSRGDTYGQSINTVIMGLTSWLLAPKKPKVP